MLLSKAATDTLEKVSGELESEALSELEEGRREALAKLAAARKDTVEAVVKVLETSSKQAESMKRQIIGAAELEARNAHLRSLERAVAEAFDSAVKELSGARGSAYEKSLARLVSEGAEVIGPRAAVHCNSRDRKAVSAVVKKLSGGQTRLTLAEKPIATIGGVVLTTSDGSVKFDNTFEARLERMRPELRREVAAILTGS